MDRNNRYFIISGFLSFFLFATFLFLFIYMMFVNKESKIYALTKKNFISVSIVMPKEVQKISSKKATATLPTSTSKSVSKDIDVNDLFSDVWTQKISHKKKRKVNSKRIQDIVKKIKTTNTNKVSSISEKIKKSDTKKGEKDAQNSSAGNEVNEYLAKIQAIVYQYFHVPPNSEGNSVKTLIEIDPLGKMTDFRVLSYSSNSALNEEVDKIKERLQNVVFPKNPHNRSSRTVVVLISKE